MDKVVVWGMGQSGQACCEYFLSQKYSVVALDKNWMSDEMLEWKLKHPQVQCVEETPSFEFESIQAVIVSPGISSSHPLMKKIEKKSIPILTDVLIGLKHTQAKVIGITGTNGKTTLTAFLAHLLQVAEKNAKAVGNIGVPLTKQLLEKEKNDFWVCELSSYQLETLTLSCIDIGILLDITPDHMDRYESFRSYALAKFNLLKAIKKGGVAIVTARAWDLLKDDIEKLNIDIIKVPTEFNIENKNCYLQLTKNKEYCDFLPIVKEKAIGLELLYIGKKIAEHFGIAEKVLYQAFATFKKPEHRLEWVATYDEVSFINDSKATNVESVIYAINTLSLPVVLIAGGKDKELSYEPWIEAFATKVSKIFAIGECREKIFATLSPHYQVQLCEDLEQATKMAFASATPHSYVLLSPGCSSFDSFRDYRHRGDTFKKIVLGLKKGLGR